MTLIVAFLTADDFAVAWVDYGLTEHDKSLLMRNLTKNPLRGKPAKADTAIREYTFKRFKVRYAVRDPSASGSITVWLLDVVPIAEEPSWMGKTAESALKGVSWLIRLSRGSIGPDKDE